MNAPASKEFWRSRAALIRELVAAGLTPPEIRKRCVAAGYEEPRPDAIWRAKTYKVKGMPPAARPSYYMLCKRFVEEFDGAYRAGKDIVLTKEMLVTVQTMEACILHDLSGDTFTDRRHPKRKKKA